MKKPIKEAKLIFLEEEKNSFYDAYYTTEEEQEKCKSMLGMLPRKTFAEIKQEKDNK